MQRYCTELTERLLKSLDKEYNVVDMGVVFEVITVLEKTTITKEVLEITRLGKHINELRRKTSNEVLAKRAKDLVRRWRGMVLPSVNSALQQLPQADSAPPILNGAKSQSIALKNLKPQSPLCKANTPVSRVSSPSLSIFSDQSQSPLVSPIKQPIQTPLNHKVHINSNLVNVTHKQNHVLEAVPRTHSSNKRLRKEDETYCTSINDTTEVSAEVAPPKRQRLNGETISSPSNCINNLIKSQVPSPTLKERNSELFEANSHIEAPTENANEGTKEKIIKKRGRKKGSKYAKKQLLVEDRVKEKLASISKNPKIKTTEELLADLQARGSNTISVNPSQSNTVFHNHILRNNNDKEVSKYLSSHQNHKGDSGHLIRLQKLTQRGQFRDSPLHVILDEDTLDSEIQTDNCTTRSSPNELSIEQILAKLPPLDMNSISWDRDEYCGNYGEEVGECIDKCVRTLEINKESIEKLHMVCVEGLNGNFQPKLLSEKTDIGSSLPQFDDNVNLNSPIGLQKPLDNHSDTEFREWHEMLARPSCDGQLLHILPYVIID